MTDNRYPYSLDFKAIGKRVMDCRKSRNWNQSQLAKKLDISQALVSWIETASIRHISKEKYNVAIRNAEKIFHKKIMDNISVHIPPNVNGVKKHICEYCSGTGFYLKAFDAGVAA